MVSFTPFVSNPNGHFGAPVAVPVAVDVPVAVAVDVDVPVAVDVDVDVPVRPAPKRAIKGKLATVVEKA